MMVPPGSPAAGSPAPDAIPDLARHLADVLLEGCQVLDFEWRYVYLNDTATAHARKARVDLLGRRIMDVYPGIETTPMFLALRRAMTLRLPARFENEFTYPDGVRAWFDLRFVPVPEGVLVLSLDVTEQKLAEEALRHSEQKYRELFDHAQVGMFRLSPDGRRVLDANIKLGEILRIRTDVLLESAGGIPWADPPEFTRFHEMLLERRTVEYAELDVITWRGERRSCLVSAAVLPNGSGIEGTLRDVTPRVRDERERLKLFTAIHQSAESVIVTDPAGAITYVNPAFERISGYGADEVAGRNPRFLKSGHQDAAFYADLWRSLLTVGVWRGRIVNRRKDGQPFTQDSTLSRVVDHNGEPLGYVCVGRDVTNELELESQLAHAQRMETIGQLAGGIAHDFNNLLAVILGSTEAALGGMPEDADLRPMLEDAHAAGLRASRLTRQLLAFGRRQAVHPEAVAPAALLREVIPMIRRLLPADITLRTEVAETEAIVLVDPTQIEQVLLNLAVNARDAMPHGGALTFRLAEVRMDGRATDRLPSIRPGRYIELAVADTGGGMSDEVRHRAFEPYFTTKPTGHGTGLGLPMVDGIVKQCGGRVHLASVPGRGTTVSLYLPVAGVKEANGQPATSPADEVPGKRELLLLVEDEPAVLAVTRRILVDAGYRVIAAGTTAEAREAIARHGREIALVVSDVMMPDGGGVVLARELADAGQTVPMLLISGYADLSVPGSVHGHVVPEVLAKPFSAAELRLRVCEALGGRSGTNPKGGEAVPPR